MFDPYVIGLSAIGLLSVATTLSIYEKNVITRITCKRMCACLIWIVSIVLWTLFLRIYHPQIPSFAYLAGVMFPICVAFVEMCIMPRTLSTRNKGSVQMDMSALMSIAMSFGASSLSSAKTLRVPLVILSTIAVVMCLMFLVPSPLVTETQTFEIVELLQRISTICISGILIMLAVLSLNNRLCVA